MSPTQKSRYQDLHSKLSREPVPRGASCRLPDNSLASFPSLVPPAGDKPETLVHRTVRDGWLGPETPAMMRDVMTSVHEVVTTLEPGVVWSGAVDNFVKMIKVASDVLAPKGDATQINVSSGVVLDTLRQVRL